jgi:hemerythrin-like metal-binding domain
MQWTENLSVGVESIDEQHKKLFEMTDQLFTAGKQNRAMEFIVELLDFMDNYTKKHFSDEEAFMLKIGYPGYQQQKKAHDELIQQLKILKKDYEASGGNIVLIINANQILLDWLIKHISGEDKKIGEFAKTLGR